MTIDFETFARRSTMLPRIPAAAPCVNVVVRFSHKKSPRDVSPTGSVAQLLTASFPYRPDDGNPGVRPRMGSDPAVCSVGSKAGSDTAARSQTLGNLLWGLTPEGCLSP